MFYILSEPRKSGKFRPEIWENRPEPTQFRKSRTEPDQDRQNLENVEPDQDQYNLENLGPSWTERF